MPSAIFVLYFRLQNTIIFEKFFFYQNNLGSQACIQNIIRYTILFLNFLCFHFSYKKCLTRGVLTPKFPFKIKHNRQSKRSVVFGLIACVTMRSNFIENSNSLAYTFGLNSVFNQQSLHFDAKNCANDHTQRNWLQPAAAKQSTILHAIVIHIAKALLANTNTHFSNDKKPPKFQHV